MASFECGAGELRGCGDLINPDMTLRWTKEGYDLGLCADCQDKHFAAAPKAEPAVDYFAINREFSSK